jgi:fucose 4-O-acetylase-like acetyltransferase
MPLFFFIAGYLHKLNPNYIRYFKKKATHLLVPYFVFLTLIFIPFAILIKRESFYKIVFKYFYGGNFLTEYVTVFWFVTCFFVTQQVFNFIMVKYGVNKRRINKTTIIIIIIIIISSLLLAYINELIFLYFRAVPFPWAINIVLYALPVYYCGYLYKQRIEYFIDGT